MLVMRLMILPQWRQVSCGVVITQVKKVPNGEQVTAINYIQHLQLCSALPAIFGKPKPLLMGVEMPHSKVLLHHDAVHFADGDDVLIQQHMPDSKAAEFPHQPQLTPRVLCLPV
jgi:hypothetical protein